MKTKGKPNINKQTNKTPKTFYNHPREHLREFSDIPRTTETEAPWWSRFFHALARRGPPSLASGESKAQRGKENSLSLGYYSPAQSMRWPGQKGSQGGLGSRCCTVHCFPTHPLCLCRTPTENRKEKMELN